MPNFDNWYGGSDTFRQWYTEQYRASSVGSIIDEKPASIVIRRANESAGSFTALAAQTVRLDTMTSPSESAAGSLIAFDGTQRVLMLGYKNHPVVADTNVKIGDTFTYNSRWYRVIMVQGTFSDRVLAVCEEQDRA